MSLEFKSIKKYSRLLDPRDNFREIQVESEIRFHPLTGRTSRIAHFATFQGIPKTDLKPLAEATRKTCPFCAETVETITPKFPIDMISEGRLKLGETVIFPNLSPYDKHSAVAVVTREHYVPLLELSAQQLTDAFSAALQYFERTAKSDPEAEYALVNWNYMPYAAATQVHAHLQVFATSTPFNHHADLINGSRAYYEKTGRNFWDDFLAEETRLDERYIGRTGNVEWLTHYTPFGAMGDIQFIFPQRSSSWDLLPKDLSDMVVGLQRLFSYFDSMGVNSFNLALYPGARGQDYFWTHGIISPRLSFNPVIGSTDLGTMRHLYNEPFSMIRPEQQRDQIKPFFDLTD